MLSDIPVTRKIKEICQSYRLPSPTVLENTPGLKAGANLNIIIGFNLEEGDTLCEVQSRMGEEPEYPAGLLAAISSVIVTVNSIYDTIREEELAEDERDCNDNHFSSVNFHINSSFDVVWITGVVQEGTNRNVSGSVLAILIEALGSVWQECRDSATSLSQSNIVDFSVNKVNFVTHPAPNEWDLLARVIS